MSDQHPIQKIIDKQKEESEALLAVAAAAEQQSNELATRVRSAWPNVLKTIRQEVVSANEVFKNNGQEERFTVVLVPQQDKDVIARATLQLEHASNGKLVTCDITVSASDGRLALHHRTRTPKRQGSGRREFNSVEQEINKSDWAEYLGSLYLSTI